MRTEHIEYLLPDYLTGRLEESLRPGVESHLAECAACRSELEVLREAFQSLRVHHAAEPPTGYFLTLLPHVRERLEGKRAKPFLSHPLVGRLVMPIAVGVLALFIVLRGPFSTTNTELERNPLQPALGGFETDELVDIVLDQAHSQALNTLSEGETSAMLAVPLLHGNHLLTGTEPFSLTGEPILGAGMPDSLGQFSDSEVEVLIARLGERTIL